jgi:para-aminobenzoate synthetase/4-amino-4-deoxychorismate lyase
MTKNQPSLELGLFETMLIHEGAALELEAHLDRLGASTLAVYGRRLPPGLWDAARDCARSWSGDFARLRVELWPVGAELRYRCEVRPAASTALGPKSPGLGLRPVQVEGGLGAHKWKDRSLLLRLGSGLEEYEELLILDAGEEVLETGTGNVFALSEDALVTPVADHRVLPGVTRARVIELAHRAGLSVKVQPLALGELGDAAEVFLTSSVRGVVPVTSFRETRWAVGDKTRTLHAALRELWRIRTQK